MVAEKLFMAFMNSVNLAAERINTIQCESDIQ